MKMMGFTWKKAPRLETVSETRKSGSNTDTTIKT
jgi:hypothetical protein